MGTALKVLKLLDSFSLQQPELGLSQIARMNHVNKATALRYLKNLTDYGLVEQDPQTKLYSIGTAPLRLANLREAAKPGLTAARQIMKTQVQRVKETMHMSLLKADVLQTALVEETRVHSMRVNVGTSERLPFHATASGIVALAFGPDDLLEGILYGSLKTFSDDTVTDQQKLTEIVGATKLAGWCQSVGGYEAGVHGYAAPIFGKDQNAIGTVAFVVPETRVTPYLQDMISAALKAASTEITSAFGGLFPADYPPEYLRNS